MGFISKKIKEIHKRQIEAINKAWEEKYNDLENRFRASLEAMSKRFDDDVKVIAENSAKEIGLARGQERMLQRPVITALEDEVLRLREALTIVKEGDADIGGLAIKAKEDLSYISKRVDEVKQGVLNVVDLLEEHDKRRMALNKSINRLGEKEKKK